MLACQLAKDSKAPCRQGALAGAFHGDRWDFVGSLLKSSSSQLSLLDPGNKNIETEQETMWRVNSRQEREIRPDPNWPQLRILAPISYRLRFRSNSSS